MSVTVRPSPANAAPVHIDGLDGLRGCAALIIVVYHMFCVCNGPVLRVHGIDVLREMQDGWCGVNLFLVLSGFCLFWPYATDPARRLSFVDFMRRRVRRIVPAYYASLILYPVLYHFVWSALHVQGRSEFPTGPLDIVLHLLLLHTLNARTYWTWNGVSWSLGLEWLWYLLFPLPVWLFRRFGPAVAVVTMASITLAYAAAVRCVAGPTALLPTETFAPLDNCVLNRLLEFGLGMLAAWWLANRQIPRGMTWAMIVLLPFLLAMAHYSVPIDAIFPARYAMYGIAFAMLVLVTVAPAVNFIRSFFCSRILRFVGEGSYSLYLLHLPLVTLISLTLTQHVRSQAVAFFLSLPFVPLVVIATRPSYLLFEKPFLKSSKSAPQRKAPAPELAAATPQRLSP